MSGDPSLTTMTSKSVKVCATTDASVSPMYGAVLYAGMMTLTDGASMRRQAAGSAGSELSATRRTDRIAGLTDEHRADEHHRGECAASGPCGWTPAGITCGDRGVRRTLAASTPSRRPRDHRREHTRREASVTGKRHTPCTKRGEHDCSTSSLKRFSHQRVNFPCYKWSAACSWWCHRHLDRVVQRCHMPLPAG